MFMYYPQWIPHFSDHIRPASDCDIFPLPPPAVLICRRFTVLADQRSIAFLLSANTKSNIKNNKLCRWKLKLSEFNYEIKYRLGHDNQGSDTLSRHSCMIVSHRSKDQVNTHRILCHLGETRMWYYIRSLNLPSTLQEVRDILSKYNVCARLRPRHLAPLPQDNAYLPDSNDPTETVELQDNDVFTPSSVSKDPDPAINNSDVQVVEIENKQYRSNVKLQMNVLPLEENGCEHMLILMVTEFHGQLVDRSNVHWFLHDVPTSFLSRRWSKTFTELISSKFIVVADGLTGQYITIKEIIVIIVKFAG
ncbi:hypothetical protein GJ496_004047 [Pomphorhynchus laevis]|nr:hypothetical protein GJ496_004047 [Pomphorhynchus laevis]